MTTNTSKVKIHMVSRLDSFIAKVGGNVSWVESTDNFEEGVSNTKEYFGDFLKSIDCYVMGS